MPCSKLHANVCTVCTHHTRTLTYFNRDAANGHTCVFRHICDYKTANFSKNKESVSASAVNIYQLHSSQKHPLRSTQPFRYPHACKSTYTYDVMKKRCGTHVCKVRRTLLVEKSFNDSNLHQICVCSFLSTYFNLTNDELLDNVESDVIDDLHRLLVKWMPKLKA